MRCIKKNKPKSIVSKNYLIILCKHKKDIVYMRHLRCPGMIRISLRPGYYEDRCPNLQKMACIAMEALASHI